MSTPERELALRELYEKWKHACDCDCDGCEDFCEGIAALLNEAPAAPTPDSECFSNAHPGCDKCLPAPASTPAEPLSAERESEIRETVRLRMASAIHLKWLLEGYDRLRQELRERWAETERLGNLIGKDREELRKILHGDWGHGKTIQEHFHYLRERMAELDRLRATKPGGSHE